MYVQQYGRPTYDVDTIMCPIKRTTEAGTLYIYIRLRTVFNNSSKFNAVSALSFHFGGQAICYLYALKNYVR